MINMYADIEVKLIREIAQRLLTYDGITGALEWYTKKLNELGALNGNAIKILSQMTGKSEQTILKMLQQAGFANIDLSMTRFGNGLWANPALIMQSPIANSIITNSYKELTQTYKLINTRAIQGTNQAYMNVLNRAYLEVSSGVYDYNTAIQRGIEDMARQGIKVAEYLQPNGTIRKYGIDSCVRRDTMTAVFQTANRVALEDTELVGAEHVEVSSHIGARTGDGIHPWSDHASWQGKIYKIEGHDEYPNLVEVTGYGDILGLGGVNCRHRMYPFVKGASVPMAEQYDYAENKAVYDATQQQRAYERKIRTLKRMKAVAEIENERLATRETAKKLKKVNSRLTETQNELQMLVDSNEYLKRHYERERI